MLKKRDLRSLNLEERTVPTSPTTKKKKHDSSDTANMPNEEVELDTSQTEGTDREGSLLRTSPYRLDDRDVPDLEIDESKNVMSDEEGDDQPGEGPILDPSEMKTHMLKFFKFLGKKDLMDKAVSHQLKKQITEYVKKTEPGFTEEQFSRSYRYYMKKASSCRTFHTDQTMMSTLFEKPSMVESYPDFPQIPHSVLHLYAQKHGMPLGFGKNAEVKKRMEADADGYQAAETEFRKMEEALVDKLTIFSAAHEEDINTQQKQFIQKRIASINRKLNPDLVVKPARSRQQKSQPPETPKASKPTSVFEMFVNSKKDLYVDLDPEKRERKLLKKYEKLSPEQRHIWESVFFSL